MGRGAIYTSTNAVFVDAVFVHAVFVHAVFVHGVFVHAVFVHAVFVHAKFYQTRQENQWRKKNKKTQTAACIFLIIFFSSVTRSVTRCNTWQSHGTGSQKQLKLRYEK